MEDGMITEKSIKKEKVEAANKEKVRPDPDSIAGVVSNNVWLITVIAAALIMCFAYYKANVFTWWWGKWMEKDSYYSHAVLVPLISAFAVYLDRKGLGAIKAKPTMLGLPLLLISTIAALIGHTAGTPSITGLTLPFVVFGSIWVLLGTEAAKRMIFPAGFLFFMCVLPGFLLTLMSFKIQLMSTTGAALLLKIAGLNPQQSGAQINLPNAAVLVGQPCSGFRLLISLLAFSVFFAYMREGPRWGKLILVASTLPLSLVVNSIRIFLIALVGEFFGSEAMHAFHDYSGYLVLVLAFAILWQISKVVQCQKFKAVLTS